MKPNSAHGREVILYITDCADINDDKLFVIPRIVVQKQGYEIIPAKGIRESISALKDIRRKVILVIVNATDGNMTRLVAQVLKVHSVRNGLPIYFLASSFPPQLQEFLVKFGFSNLISLSSSTPAELVKEMDSMIRNIGKSHDNSAKKQKYQIVNDVRLLKSLPPLPDVYFRIESLSHDDSATSADFSQVLELDPSITARLLRMSNSAYFGFKREIKSVKDAVTLMGIKEIVSLVRIACITNNLKVSPQVENMAKNVWIHSATCAITAQLISRKRGISNKNTVKEDLLICGILHDIGKIVLWKFFPDIYMPVALNCTRMRPTDQEELNALGCTHSEIGKTLADHWQLPEHISNVIAFHHKPLVKQDSELVFIIHLADLVCKIVQNDYQLDDFTELDAPGNDLYTRDEIASLARELEPEIREQSEHVVSMIFR